MTELIRVFMAKFYKDKPLQNRVEIPRWLTPVQAGAALTKERVADILDCDGDNISRKNPNYCELTVLYWIWKHCLVCGQEWNADYCGLFHYRRWLDIREEKMGILLEHDIDVILPYPTMHEPDIKEHHARYIKESDWKAALQAVGELEPAYYGSYSEIFAQEYLYNYNILIAKKDILRGYCEWLFPILERTEELSSPRGNQRSDRYIGYIGENLLTLYFMCRRKDFHIVHTGRRMLT